MKDHMLWSLPDSIASRTIRRIIQAKAVQMLPAATTVSREELSNVVVDLPVFSLKQLLGRCILCSPHPSCTRVSSLKELAEVNVFLAFNANTVQQPPEFGESSARFAATPVASIVERAGQNPYWPYD